MSSTSVTKQPTKHRLRVLIVAPTFPFPPISGFNMRSSQLALQIAKRHDVTFLSYAWPDDGPQDGPHVAELEQSMRISVVRRRARSRLVKRIAQLASLVGHRPFACQAVHTREMQGAIDGLTAATRFDLIHVESVTMTAFRFPPGVPIVLDEHNIEYELYERLYRGERHLLRRIYNGIEFVRMRRFERHCWQAVQACAVTSEREQPIVDAVAPDTPTVVVSNGVDLEYFARYTGDTSPRTAVFVGVFNYRPNTDAAHYLVHEVWPLVRAKCPDATLTLVGTIHDQDALALAAPGVEIAGRVPDVRPYLHRAEVVAVPVRIGSGTRLKVVEAFSVGKAMVSTTLGCEGIASCDGEHLLIADDAEAFASRIVELFESPEQRDRLGAAGRALAEAKYSWDVAGDRLDELYQVVAPITVRTADDAPPSQINASF